MIFEEIALTYKGGRSEFLLVTFAGYNYDQGLDRFFGMRFASKNGLSVVGVSAARNHWWNTSDFEPAMRKVKEIAAGRPIVAYGSSMGGFGAILADRYLSPVRIVVASPQLAIGSSAPWEKRWASDFLALNIVEACAADCLSNRPDVYVLYDPKHKSDARHVELLSLHPNVTKLPVPWGGHLVLHTMKEGGFLSSVVLDLLRGQLESKDFNRLARKRRLSSTYLAEIATALANRKQPNLRAALEIVERSITCPGLSPFFLGSRLMVKARLLFRMERYVDALNAVSAMERLREPTASARSFKELIIRRIAASQEGSLT